MVLVIDTNCLLVSIPRYSNTRWLFDALREGKFQFAVTTEILGEYDRWNLIPDQDDNKFVDCAISCQADYVITHDRHFNVLLEIPFPKVNILKMPELKAILGL